MGRKWRNRAAIALAVLLLVYVGNQLYNMMKKGISTEIATYATVSDTIQTKGYAIRLESLIQTEYNGVVSYVVADGSRVAAGETIANIYDNENDATAQVQINRLDEEIQLLQSLSNPGDSYISNPELVNKQIQSSMNNVLKTVKTEDFSTLADSKRAFLTSISLKNIVTGKETAEDYNSRIATLQSQMETLKNSTSGRIDYVPANMSGYFISQVDGLEQSVPAASAAELAENVGKLSVSDVRELLAKQQTNGGGAIGKISGSFNWYIAVVLTKDEMAKMLNERNVNIQTTFAANEKIPATIIAKNKDAATGETAVIFQCNYMNPDIAKIRNEAIQINVRDYSGVLVNERAITFEDVPQTITDEDGTTHEVVHKKVRGVYIKDGSVIRFVQIFTDKTINGYAICKTTLSDDESKELYTSRTIQLYDEVIVDETDMYDGKMVD